MKKFKCANCGMDIGEEIEGHKTPKVIRAFVNICMKCVEQMDNYSKGYNKGYNIARKEMRDYLK